MMGLQLCLTLIGGGIDHSAIFHKMDPKVHWALDPKFLYTLKEPLIEDHYDKHTHVL